MNMKLHLLVWWYQYRCFNTLLFDQFPSLLTFLFPKKSLYLYGQLSDKCHNNNNLFDKTSIKLCHPIEYLKLLWNLMFTIACIFFGSGSFPYLEMIKPRIILENTMNAHLFGFRLMPYSFHFWASIDDYPCHYSL
jgi:hypothetical protein